MMTESGSLSRVALSHMFYTTAIKEMGGYQLICSDDCWFLISVLHVFGHACNKQSQLRVESNTQASGKDNEDATFDVSS